MKKNIYKILCILLAGVLCLSLAACSGQRGGIGSISMDIPDQTENTDNKGGIGSLGGSDGSTPSSGDETDPVSEPGPTQPEPTKPEPTQPEPIQPVPPTPTGIATEEYSCDEFTMTIPAGWTVTSKGMVTMAGTMQLYVFVTDPADTNNQIFFCGALEPFFSSQQQRNSAVSVLGSIVETAPVLSVMTAEETLREWGTVYAFMQAAGTGFDKLFRNYSVQSVIESTIAENSTDEAIASDVTCSVTVPGSSKTYKLQYNNIFMYHNYYYFDYYVCALSAGICLAEDRPDADIQTLYDCLLTLDISKFNDKYL